MKINKNDLSLSFKLLKLINSANYGFNSPIKSISQALALVGEKEIKKWLYLVVFKTLGEEKPEIIAINSLVRARFAELIASKMGTEINSFNAYLIGLLSMIDVILEVPLNVILEELLLPLEVKDALIGVSNNAYSILLNLIIAYEKAEWDQVSKISKQLNLDEKHLPSAYYESLCGTNIK